MPGGHEVIVSARGNPFITPVRECNSIPLEPWDVVVDIGAYVGTYAIRCARTPVRKVIAYEPTPATFEVLNRVQLPNLEQRQAAIVADDSKTVALHLSKGIGVTNSCVPSSSKPDSVEVPAVRYEDAVRDATIVKIDVEGAEYSYPVVQPGIRALIIDFHPLPGVDWIADAERMIAEIEDAGFTAVISPEWGNGWTRAGSWIRPFEPWDSSGFEPMLQGKVCCGCGLELDGAIAGRCLCSTCWPKWTKTHRKGYSKV